MRRSKRIWLGMVGVFLLVFGVTFVVNKIVDQDAKAANFSGFDAGYIISDYQMTNYNSMNEAQIQTFLKSKVDCNDRDLGKYTYGNKVGYYSESLPYTWHVADGHFVCMADENINGESAAHIIWQAAQDYRINPQVLITVLQKEQWLVSDSFPNSVQYKSAMGYGCPDTAPCSPKYAGFKNQVRNAAEMFREVMDGGWSTYPVGQTYVQYNPNADCGGSVVNIRNKATSALYRYTPYQPNAAALSVPMGYTVSCGAYGNKNFYGIFEDWFGGITDEGWPSEVTLLSTNRATTESSDLDMEYQTHIEHYGWLHWVDGGVMGGTAGFSLRMEAISIRLKGEESGIKYRTHIEDVGWTNYSSDGEISGSTGQSKRLEAIQIQLDGELAKIYDVYYRVHVENIGWTDWVKNGEISGTTGRSLRAEAMQIKILNKKSEPFLNYDAHVQDIGWMKWVDDGELAGTTGRSLRLEALRVKFKEKLDDKTSLSCAAHVEDIGWMNYVNEETICGTTNKSKRLEAIKLRLSKNLEEEFDIYYRVHVQNIGWMRWVKNGEEAGTTGRALRIEALEIRVIKKR